MHFKRKRWEWFPPCTSARTEKPDILIGLPSSFAIYRSLKSLFRHFSGNHSLWSISFLKNKDFNSLNYLHLKLLCNPKYLQLKILKCCDSFVQVMQDIGRWLAALCTYTCIVYVIICIRLIELKFTKFSLRDIEHSLIQYFIWLTLICFFLTFDRWYLHRYFLLDKTMPILFFILSDIHDKTAQ